MASDGGRPLAAGVIGLGAMGINHARVYGEMAGVELVAVADPAPDRRQPGRPWRQPARLC